MDGAKHNTDTLEAFVLKFIMVGFDVGEIVLTKKLRQMEKFKY